MTTTPIRTPKITAGQISLPQLLDDNLPALPERCVVVITSKVVSLCENRVVPIAGTDKEALIRREAQYYYRSRPGEDEHMRNRTIAGNTFISAAGIDASNGHGHYVLWPENPQTSANSARRHLRQRHRVRHVGVIIVDSVIGLSRWGTVGIAIAHSGFAAIKNYIGEPDLFGRTLEVSKANIAGGLASAAVLMMGEGNEQTPLALIQDLPNVQFVGADPAPADIAEYYVSPLDDEPFKPFFANGRWRRGGQT